MVADICLGYHHILRFHDAYNVRIFFDGMEGGEDDYGYHRLVLTSSLVLIICAINGALSGRIRGAVVIKCKERK